MPSSHLLRASDHPPSQTFCLDPSPQGMRKIRDRSARPCHGPDRSDPARAPHRLACSRARPHARCLRSEPARPLTTAHSHPPTEASRAADGARERSALRVDPPGLAGRAGRRTAAPLAAVPTCSCTPRPPDFASKLNGFRESVSSGCYGGNSARLRMRTPLRILVRLSTKK